VYSRPVASAIQRLIPLLRSAASGDPMARLSNREFLDMAYQMVLNRDPDVGGLRVRLAQLEAGSISSEATLEELRVSPEAQEIRMGASGALHLSRTFFVRSLPEANRILDLGGVNLHDDQGALVFMGYPYDFSELVIVDLPDEQRHPLYQTEQVPAGRVSSARGPLRYEYHSMADLSRYESGSFDLVYSGQSFEHITREEGSDLLTQIRRVLRPGGSFALDTPNRAATEVELQGSGQNFIDPDHKVEYHHRELVEMFEQAGFEIAREHGLNLVDRAIASGQLDHAAIAERPGLFDAIEDCYIVAYVLTTPVLKSPSPKTSSSG